jgi:hypothetical protein
MVFAIKLRRWSMEASYAGGRENGQLRESSRAPCRPSWCSSGRANLHPVVLQLLDGDIAFGKQLYVVIEFARGDGAGAFFLHRGGAGRTQTEIEVGCGDGKPSPAASKRKFERIGIVVLRSTTPLRRGELSQQLSLGNDDFHSCTSCCAGFLDVLHADSG